jgi:hypothetical protein
MSPAELRTGDSTVLAIIAAEARQKFLASLANVPGLPALYIDHLAAELALMTSLEVDATMDPTPPAVVLPFPKGSAL